MTRPILTDQQLDQLLVTIADPPFDPALAARIARVARSAPRPVAPRGLAGRLGHWLGFDGPVPWLWQQATGLAALALVGFFLGYGNLGALGLGTDPATRDTGDPLDAFAEVSDAFQPLPALTIEPEAD